MKPIHVVILVCLVVLLAIFVCWPRVSIGPVSAKIPQAITDISALGVALGAFKADNGRYPTTAEGLAALSTAPSGLPNWKGPYIYRPAGNDPWGNPYVYVCPGKHNPDSYDLHSFGPDGKDGTADDIDNWTQR